jgi:hypothetical protein
MRGAILSIVGMLLLGAGVAVGWFASRHWAPASGENTVPTGSPANAKFWSDDEAAKAIRSLGYDEAYLFRWQNSHVTGWVELEGEDGPKHVDLDSRRALDERGQPLDGGRLSGFVVVAMRKWPSAEWEEYEVQVEQRCEYDMGSIKKTYNGTSQVAKLKRSSKKELEGGTLRTASGWTNCSATLMKYVDGKSADWFELRLTAPR